MAKIKPKIQLTSEQIRENELQLFIKNKTELLPNPTYFYQVGERVTIGALKDVYVSEIFLDGKIYEIDYTSIDHNYGNPIRNEHQKMFVIWLDIRPFYKGEKISLIKNDDLHLSYSQRDIGDIFSKVYKFGVNFEPDYQRDYVWDLEDKIALIDSIFNSVDIGKFVYIHKGYNEKYVFEILDGKQRIRAILDYYENKFAFKGLYFNDLSYRDQNHFEMYSISVAEVRDISREQILRYFVKLNKHGKVMDKLQIEKVERMIDDIRKEI